MIPSKRQQKYKHNKEIFETLRTEYYSRVTGEYTEIKTEKLLEVLIQEMPYSIMRLLRKDKRYKHHFK